MVMKYIAALLFISLFNQPLLAKDVHLPAGEKLKLNDDWISYTSKKILKKVSSYPLLESKDYEGLMGILNTEVKFFNPEKESGVESWLEGECGKLKNLYVNGVVTFKERGFCRVELPSTRNSKGMIQYLKAKEVESSKTSSSHKVFVYIYSFYLPKKERVQAHVTKHMVDAVEKLMKSNL